jgi:hypothetical protein
MILAVLLDGDGRPLCSDVAGRYCRRDDFDPGDRPVTGALRHHAGGSSDDILRWTEQPKEPLRMIEPARHRLALMSLLRPRRCDFDKPIRFLLWKRQSRSTTDALFLRSVECPNRASSLSTRSGTYDGGHVSTKHKFLFNLEEIEHQINALYELDDALMDALAEGEDRSVYDSKARELRSYFECLADSLWEGGAFKSREEARSFIKADVDVLQRAGGPGGLRPDDGLLDPDEMAQGIVALRNLNEFIFQAPVCLWLRSADRDVDYTTHAGGSRFRLTSNYEDLSLVKRHRKLRADEESKDYLWVEGSVKAHRYDGVRPEIDRLLVSAMGMMEVIGLVRYESWPRRSSRVSIGTKDCINSGTYNSGEYYDMHSVRIAQHLVGLCDPTADNEIDRARTRQERVDANLRILGRSMSDLSPAALAVQHACRTYLRAYEAWNVGESAMFLAITMEGLMLDKRQKDDLSARLQDSVAYWLGGSSNERQKNRKYVSELYKVRSNYVHNGEDAPSAFDVEGVRELTRRVLRKELLTLES